MSTSAQQNLLGQNSQSTKNFYYQDNERKYEKENRLPSNIKNYTSTMANAYNTQQNSQKHFISSQGKSKRDLNHSYDMPRTHSTQTLKSYTKSNINNTSQYIQTSLNQPNNVRHENCSYINTTDNENCLIENSTKNVDRSFQYIKNQFNIQNDLSMMQEQEWSSIYDIIPSRQPNTSFKNSEYSFSKIYHRNQDESMRSKNSHNKTNNHHSMQRNVNIERLNFDFINQQQRQSQFNDLSSYEEQISQINNSFTPMQSDHNQISLNYSMNLPQSTKNVNMTDIMYSTNKRRTGDYRSNNNNGTKPSHHLQQMFTITQDKTGQRFIQKPNMSMLSQTFEMEDDYRLQLIYMRLWQKAIQKIKKRRAEKKVFLKNLATAIHFNEQSLMTKVMLSFIKFRVQSELNYVNAMKISKKVTHNIKRFYLKQLISKFKESKWIKSGQTIASIYFNKETRKKIFKTLRAFYIQHKQKRLRFLEKLKRKPQSLQLILQYIAINMTGKSKVDLLKFHSIAIAQGKIKHQLKNAFTQQIELALIYQMRTLFNQWRKFVTQILNLKQRVNNKKKRYVFNVIKQRLLSKKKAQTLLVKVFLNIKYKCLLNLRLNADLLLLLKKKQHIVQRRFKKRVYSKFFQKWRGLFFQYRALMSESISKNQQSRINFLKKYFQAILDFKNERQKQKSQRLKSMIHYYDRYLKNCFSNWKQISSKRSLTNKARRIVKYNHNLDVKDKFFKEWMKRCYQNEMIRRYRVKNLKTKFIQSLKLAVRYKYVRKEIMQISQEQYLRSLKHKSIKSLRVKILKRQRLLTLENTLLRKSQEKIVAQIFDILRDNIERNYQHREQQEIVLRFRTSLLQFKFFDRLKRGCYKQKILNQNFLKVQNYVQSKMKFRTLQKFAKKLDSKQQLKYYQFQFLLRNQTKIKQKIFYFMLNKKRQLNHKSFQISQMIEFKNRATIFRQWYQAACQIYYLRNGYQQLQSLQINNNLKKYWNIWNKYVEKVVLQKKFRQVAIYFFLQKFLRKYLNSLRNHALIKIQKRTILRNLVTHRFKHQFVAFKKVLVKDIMKKKVYFRQVSTTLKKVIFYWTQYAQKRKYLRQNKIQLVDKREQTLKSAIISVLKQNKDCLGLCEQDQYKYMRQRKQQEIIELFFRYSQQSKRLKTQYNEIKQKQQVKIIKEGFSQMRQQYKIIKKEKTIAIPFFQEILTVQKAQIFFNWKFYSQNQRKYKEKFAKINQRHQSIIKNNAITLMKYNLIAQRKKKSDFSRADQIQKIHLKLKLFYTLKKNCNRNQQFKQGIQKTLLKQSKANLLKYFDLWIERYNRWMNFKPKMQQADQLYNYLLAKRALNSFKEYHAILQKKKEMINSILLYRQELMMHKSFLKFKCYYQSKLRIQSIYSRQQVQFKSRFFKLWHFNLIQQQKIKKQALNQQRVLYLLQSHNTSLKKVILQAFKNVQQTKQNLYQGLKVLEKVCLTLRLKEYFNNLVQHSLLERKFETADLHQESQQKQRVMKAFKFFMSTSKLSQTKQYQCEAFLRLLYLKKVVKALKNNQTKQIQMRQVYSRTNKAYRRQLSQKALWTLHWNKMRNHYLRGLVLKSGEYNDKRIQQKLFNYLKKQLIIKYQGLSIKQKREYRLLSDYLSFWRYQFEQIQAERELKIYHQNSKINLINNNSGFNVNLQANFIGQAHSEDHSNQIQYQGSFNNSLEGCIQQQNQNKYLDDDFN